MTKGQERAKARKKKEKRGKEGSTNQQEYFYELKLTFQPAVVSH